MFVDLEPGGFIGAMTFSLSATASAVGITLSEREAATWLGGLVAVGVVAADLVWAWAGAGCCSSGVLTRGQVALEAMALSLSATASAVGITLSEREVATWPDELVAVGFAAADLVWAWAGAGFCSSGVLEKKLASPGQPPKLLH